MNALRCIPESPELQKIQNLPSVSTVDNRSRAKSRALPGKPYDKIDQDIQAI
jgi:hypothetical protein